MNTDTSSARSNRRSASLQSILNLVLVLAILVMVNYLGFKYYIHKDLSSSQYYTLSPKTKEVLKKLDAPLTIYTFLDPKNAVQAEQIATLLKEYQRVGGKNVEVEKIDPAYDITRATELQKKLRFDGNDHLVILEYKDAAPRFVKQDDLYEINPMTQEISKFKGEQQLTSTILSMEEGKPALVYFTQGHGEHPLEDSATATGYGFIAANLKTDNVATADLNLAQKGEVPADADAVVIAGPSISFSPLEVEALDKYLANNGKLFVLLDPYVVSGLDALLKKYDLQYEDDLVLYRAMTTSGAQMTIPLAPIYQSGFSNQPITAKFAQANLQLLIQTARSITILPGADKDNPKAQPLLQTDPAAWGWISKDANPPADAQQITYNKVTDIPGPVTIAAQYDGGPLTDPTDPAAKTATRVVAIGSSKFVENDNYDGAVGANFFTNCLDWLVKKNAVLDISPKKPQEYGISINPISLRTLNWCALVIFPGAALIWGIVTWISRRK
jgi:ABC-type uncharacterized transport system involved in gliding motility auxiliary subunit